MPVVRVMSRPCAATPACGEDVDQARSPSPPTRPLADQAPTSAGHNLANDPMAFANDKTVRAFLEVAGSEGLPLTTVDGVTVMTGTYPSRDQLARFAGVDAGSAVPAGATLLQVDGDASDSACGCGPSGCC